LHADVGAHGWGWAIDNLAIQEQVAPPPPPPPPPLVLAAEPASYSAELQVTPNPSSQLIRVKLRVDSSDEPIKAGILNGSGQWVQQENIQVKGGIVDKLFDVSMLPAGIYYVQLIANGSVYNKRIIVVR
jgi:hypothetical protein